MLNRKLSKVALDHSVRFVANAQFWNLADVSFLIMLKGFPSGAVLAAFCLLRAVWFSVDPFFEPAKG